MADLVYGDTPEGRKQRQEEAVLDTVSLGMADMRGGSARNAAANTINNVALPTYDLATGYEAPGYAGNFDPSLYGSPEEAKYQLAQDSAEGRAAQLAALKALGEQSDQAVGSQQDLDRVQAMQDAAQFAQGREGMIRQDAARRGQIGGAADMIMRAQAAQDAANRNQMGGLQSAQMAALQRLAGTQAQAGLAGQLRGQDQNLSMSNADIINKFNLYNTGNRNQANAANVDLRNKAGLRNLDATQGWMNQGADARNESLNRRDRLMTQDFGNKFQKAGGVANALGGIAAGSDANAGRGKELFQTMLKFAGAGMENKK